MTIAAWTARPRPSRVSLNGRFCRLVPIHIEHSPALFKASAVSDAAQRFAYLADLPPQNLQQMDDWILSASRSDDPLFFTLLDATGAAIGRQALMRIDPTNGVLEIGNIYWGPEAARKPAATESIYLLLCYAFDKLGYRRVEWKCNSLNLPSRAAALRFGFQYEGLFRNHMVVKGQNRDTTWFAMTDEDWPRLKQGYDAWLMPANFDADGQQRQSLRALYPQGA